MRKVWILALFISAVFAEVRIPEPWAPGRWDSARNPARMQNGFRLGLLWTEPMENLDYEVFGFAAEWGTEAYRFKAVFASSFSLCWSLDCMSSLFSLLLFFSFTFIKYLTAYGSSIYLKVSIIKNDYK